MGGDSHGVKPLGGALEYDGRASTTPTGGQPAHGVMKATIHNQARELVMEGEHRYLLRRRAPSP
jgi:hypothetical protein